MSLYTVGSISFLKAGTTAIRQLSSTVHPPTLTQYDEWGRRVDHLHTSEGWRSLKALAIKEGYIHIPYARKYGEHSRIYGFLKAMIMTGDFHVVSCAPFLNGPII